MQSKKNTAIAAIVLIAALSGPVAGRAVEISAAGPTTGVAAGAQVDGGHAAAPAAPAPANARAPASMSPRLSAQASPQASAPTTAQTSAQANTASSLRTQQANPAFGTLPPSLFYLNGGYLVTQGYTNPNYANGYYPGTDPALLPCTNPDPAYACIPSAPPP